MKLLFIINYSLLAVDENQVIIILDLPFTTNTINSEMSINNSLGIHEAFLKWVCSCLAKNNNIG